MSFTVQANSTRVGPGVIGDQVWMTRNLDVTTYQDGTPIPEVTSIASWGSLTTGAWCWWRNSSASGSVYGRFYNWYAVNDPRGLAPKGWRIPSSADWATLFNLVGGSSVAVPPLRATGTTYWSNAVGTNTVGFNALGTGYRYNFQISLGDNGFIDEKIRAWYYASNGDMINLNSFSNTVVQWPFGTLSPRLGLSVRCIKN